MSTELGSLRKHLVQEVPVLNYCLGKSKDSVGTLDIVDVESAQVSIERFYEIAESICVAWLVYSTLDCNCHRTPFVFDQSKEQKYTHVDWSCGRHPPNKSRLAHEVRCCGWYVEETRGVRPNQNWSVPYLALYTMMSETKSGQLSEKQSAIITCVVEKLRELLCWH